MIRLSKRQRGEADRVGGIELILPYPSHLTPPSLDEDEECEARLAEDGHARALLGDVGAQGLVCVHVRVVRLRRQGVAPVSRRPVRYYLSATLIGRRWVRASVTHRPRTMWSREALDE